MADVFNPRKPKNSCDLSDRWNFQSANADIASGSSNLNIFPQPNSDVKDLFQKETPICWDRASARFGTALLLAEKSPLTSQTRPLFQCSVVPLDNPGLASIFLLGLGHLLAFSRWIKYLAIDGSEDYNSLHEVSFQLPEQGIIKFKVLVDKEGKITPALNEARNFLDKAVAANQLSSADFAIETSAENLNQFVLKSGSIELTVNLEFVQEANPPTTSGTVTYTNQRVILAKSQPLSPLKIGDEKERARFASQKKAGPIALLQRQIVDLPKVQETSTYFSGRIEKYLTSPGKVHQIMLSDGNVAVVYIMNSDAEPPSPSLLYIPNHQTGEMRSVELRDTGKGFVAEGYDYGFRVDRAGSPITPKLVDRKTIEPEKIDLQKELETLEVEARDDSFSRENQYINRFRRAVIATFIGNEHLLSGSDLLTQLKRRQGETLDGWRIRALRTLETFGGRTNEFKVAGSGYSTPDAPKKFFDAELNPPQPKTKPGEPAPKPNLCHLLRTPISDSDLERRINEIPDPRSLMIERGTIPDPSDRQLEALKRALTQSPTEAEQDALASLPDRGAKPARPEKAQRAALSIPGAAEPLMSIPELPPAVTPVKLAIRPTEAVEQLLRNFSPLASPPEPRTVIAYSAFGEKSIVTEVTVEHLGMEVKENNESEHLFRLSVKNGPTIYLAVKKKKAGNDTFYTPMTALVDGENADQLKELGRKQQHRLLLRRGALGVSIDPLLFTKLITDKPVRADFQLIAVSGFTPHASVPPPPISRPDEPMSIDPSLRLQPQTAFADFGVREEVVEKVADRFGIAIDSIWDLADSAHRGMSLDQITQTGNHFTYQRAGSRLQIEFDRSSTNPHFADVANLRITYDGQEIPFEYTVEHGRPYLLLKGGLHGVVFYLSPTDQENYAVTEATHPVIREQAERDMGHTAPPRPDNIPYSKIRENFLSLPSNPDEQTLAEQIYRNRLGRLREAGVLPESLNEQTLIAKRLGANAENFDRRNVATFPLLHKLEEIAGDKKLKEQLKEGLQRLAIASDDQKTQEALSLLQKLEREVDSAKSEERSPVADPPAKEALSPEPVVSENLSTSTPPVCEAPSPVDKITEPLASRQPPPDLLVQALKSLGEPGEALIRAFFPSADNQAAESNPPTFEAVKDAFFGIAEFFGISKEQLTVLLSSDSANGHTTEAVQTPVDRIPESEPVCQQPAQSQSIPPENVGENPTNAGFDENNFMQELNKILNREESFPVRLTDAISYTKASGSPEIRDWLLAIETGIVDTRGRGQVLWSFFDSLRRYPEATTPVERKVYSAMRKVITDTEAREKAVELLKKSVEATEQERKEKIEERLKDLMEKR